MQKALKPSPTEKGNFLLKKEDLSENIIKQKKKENSFLNLCTTIESKKLLKQRLVCFSPWIVWSSIQVKTSLEKNFNFRPRKNPLPSKVSNVQSLSPVGIVQTLKCFVVKKH